VFSRQETYFPARHGRILIASLIVGSLAMVAVLGRYYARQRDAIRAAATQELAAIARVKASQIANWRSERLGDGRVQAASGTMRIARRILSSPATSAADWADLLAVMSSLSQQFLYTGAALVDRDGKVRVQFAPDHPVPFHLRELARAAAQADDVTLEDLYLDADLGRPLMALTIPVHGLGALILEIDPARFLYPYIASWPVPSATAESFLGRQEGNNQYLYLSDQGLRRTALVVRQPSPPVIVPDPLLGTGVLWRGLDYRGMPVLVVVQLVPDSGWFLDVKIDTAEVEAPVRRLSLEMALIMGLLGLTSVAGVGLIWRDRQVRMHQHQEALLQAVADDTPAYLWISFGAEANYILNKPLARFVGHGPRGEGWIADLHPDDAERVGVHFRECLAERREFFDEFRLRRFDGEYRWVVDQAVPRLSAQKDFLGYAGAILDITERRQAEEQLREANTALAAELAERTRNEQEIHSLSARLMNAQEEERARVARELHDDLSQQIAALSIAMGNLKRHAPHQEADVPEQSGRFQQKLVQLAETVRRISHQLHPAVLEHAGLVSALRAYCDEFGELTGIQVALRAEGSFDHLPPLVALGLYRIVQEALQNVAKHAQVKDAEVDLEYVEGMLSLTIADQGVGMELHPEQPPAGLGLISIKERARLLNGVVAIQSKPNQGTTITVKLIQGMSQTVGAT